MPKLKAPGDALINADKYFQGGQSTPGLSVRMPDNPVPQAIAQAGQDVSGLGQDLLALGVRMAERDKVRQTQDLEIDYTNWVQEQLYGQGGQGATVDTSKPTAPAQAQTGSFLDGGNGGGIAGTVAAGAVAPTLTGWLQMYGKDADGLAFDADTALAAKAEEMLRDLKGDTRRLAQQKLATIRLQAMRKVYQHAQAQRIVAKDARRGQYVTSKESMAATFADQSPEAMETKIATWENDFMLNATGDKGMREIQWKEAQVKWWDAWLTARVKGNPEDGPAILDSIEGGDERFSASIIAGLRAVADDERDKAMKMRVINRVTGRITATDPSTLEQALADIDASDLDEQQKLYAKSAAKTDFNAKVAIQNRKDEQKRRGLWDGFFTARDQDRPWTTAEIVAQDLPPGDTKTMIDILEADAVAQAKGGKLVTDPASFFEATDAIRTGKITSGSELFAKYGTRIAFQELKGLEADIASREDLEQKPLFDIKNEMTDQYLLDVLGEEPSKKGKLGESDAAQLLDFQRDLDREVQIKANKEGRKLTKEEVREIGQRLMDEVVIKKGWLWDTVKRRHELEMPEDVKERYPDAEWSEEHQMWTVVRNGRLLGVSE